MTRRSYFLRRMYCCALVLFLFHLIPSNASVFAQATPISDTLLLPTTRFTHLTTEQRLAENHVQAILQDQQGFLWFGTEDGLSRFDGYDIVTFKHDPNQPNDLPGNLITGLVEDAEGMIWITTTSGVSRFDPRQERFTNVSTVSSNTNLLASVFHAIYRDRYGDLWFGGPPGVGLVGYEVATKQLTHFDSLPNVTALQSGTLVTATWGNVGQIIEDQQGQLWVVTETDLFQYNEHAAHFRVYSILPTYPQEGRLKALLTAKDGGLWVGGTSGLYYFDTTNGSFARIANSPATIEVMQRDPQGTIWLGTTTGLYPFDESARRILTPFQHNPNQPGSLSHDHILSLHQDRQGLMWIGTSGGGVDRFSPGATRFVSYSYDPLRTQSLAGAEVDALLSDKQTLWLASADVLHHIDLASKQVKQFRLPTPDTESVHDQPVRGQTVQVQDVIHCLLRDHKGKIWIGTRRNHLWEFDPISERFVEHMLVESSAPRHLGPPREIVALAEDRAGNLWVAMSWVGLYRLDVQRNAIQRFVANGPRGVTSDDPTTIARADLRTLTAAPDGTIWLGYVDGSLSQLEPIQARFRHYPATVEIGRFPGAPPPGALPPGAPPPGAPPPGMPPPDCTDCPPPPVPPSQGPPQGPPSILASKPATSTLHGLGGWIETLFVDQRGLVWVGTRDGLIRFDPKSEFARRYTEQDGLPTNYIVAIGEDDLGQLWLGTKKGLVRFEPSQGAVRTFETSDGLPSNEFLQGAVTKTDEGTLYFGGRNGLTAFNPRQLNDDPTETPVLLTGLRLFNLPVAIGENTLLQEAPWATDQVTLQPDQQIISFEFASLNYRAPQKNRYRYKLDGLEATWNEVESQRRFATYTNLPPGDYTFRVQGSNADGVWSKQEVALALTVLPPWWQTIWFRSLAATTLLLLAFVGYSYRIRSIQARNRLLETQVKERTQALAESEARFRGLATSTFEAILVHEHGQLLDANHAAEELFGFEREELLRHSLSELVPDLSTEPNTDRLMPVAEVQGMTAHGNLIPLEARSRYVPFQGREATVVTLHNLSERKQVEAQQQQVAAFEERERIGRDLHDNLGQVIGYMSIQAQTVSDLLDQSKTPQARAALRQLVEAAHDAHADIRQYILNIRTHTASDQMSLVDALQLYLDQVTERHSLQVDLSLPNDLPDDLLSTEAETQLLRIIQEAITNIHKHAGVLRARITVTLHPDELQIIIADEGKGFAAEQSEPGTRNTEHAIRNIPHFGLEIMRERAEGIGGRLDLRSKPGTGTQVIVRLPRRLQLPHTGKANTDEIRGLRVLLVDDHPLYVQGLRNLLSARGVQVVGMAHNGVEALQLARKLLPDLILMDIDMPHSNGIETTRLIKQELPDIKIVMLTVAASEGTLFESLKQGASGYLLKNLEADQLFDLLGEVIHGELVLSPQLASKILASYAKSADESSAGNPAAVDGSIVEKAEEPINGLGGSASSQQFTLSYRQQEVLELVAQGLSNKEIAQRLGITERTVKFHVGTILEGFQLRNRFELTHYVYKVRKEETKS